MNLLVYYPIRQKLHSEYNLFIIRTKRYEIKIKLQCVKLKMLQALILWYKIMYIQNFHNGGLAYPWEWKKCKEQGKRITYNHKISLLSAKLLSYNTKQQIKNYSFVIFSFSHRKQGNSVNVA